MKSRTRLLVPFLLFASMIGGFAGCGEAPEETPKDEVEVSSASVACRVTQSYQVPVSGSSSEVQNIFCRNSCTSPILHCTWTDGSGVPHAVPTPTTGLVSEAFTSCSAHGVCN
jgi:hypothetical protein